MTRRDEYAREVLRAGSDLNITPRGIVIGFATVSVECDWIMYANAKVPESLNLPHEKVGSDGKSVGLFQQQVIWGNGAWWWGDAADCMDPYRSARMFFQALSRFDYSGTAHTPGWYAQQVQKSAFPDRYDQRMSQAEQLYYRIATDPGTPGKDVHTVGDPVWLADVLRAEGLVCDIFPGAFERGHGDFGSIWGIVAHHTGANGSPGPGAIANHPSLGLASQLHLDRNGKYTLCGVGIAWHAGQGSWPGIARDNANQVTIGIEAENNGTEGWSAAQYGAYVRGCGAILRKLGRDSSHVIGHKEWAGPAQGKWDPGGIDMDDFRRDVQAVIDGKEGDDMPSAEEVAKAVWAHRPPGPDGKVTTTAGERLVWTDHHAGLGLDQLAGPGSRDQPGALDPPGWPQLGDPETDARTMVNAQAVMLRLLYSIENRIAVLEAKAKDE